MLAHPATLLPLALAALLAIEEPPAAPASNDEPRVLVYTVSAGYRHEVVTPPSTGGLSLVERTLVELGREGGPEGSFEAVVTRDTSWFSAENLAGIDLVFFYTSGELPLSRPQREALIEFVARGGGFAGVHSATDTLHGFPAYAELVGAVFDGHPWHEPVRIVVEDREHPSTRHLGESFSIEDEIYQFRAPYDRAKLHVLLRLDAQSAGVEREGVHRKDGDFALAWCKEHGRGRVFYTALGHRPEVWRDERFRRHLFGGLAWAMRLADRPARPAADRPKDAPAPRAPDPTDYGAYARGHPGDPRLGRKVFEGERSACIRCHAVSGAGQRVGPDLTAVGGRYGREELVRAVLEPSERISEGYGAVSVELDDGTLVFGQVRGEERGELVLFDTDGRERRIPSARIASRRASPLSIMPDGLEGLLSPDEFADLIAFLESLR